MDTDSNVGKAGGGGAGEREGGRERGDGTSVIVATKDKMHWTHLPPASRVAGSPASLALGELLDVKG